MTEKQIPRYILAMVCDQTRETLTKIEQLAREVLDNPFAIIELERMEKLKKDADDLHDCLEYMENLIAKKDLLECNLG